MKAWADDARHKASSNTARRSATWVDVNAATNALKSRVHPTTSKAGVHVIP